MKNAWGTMACVKRFAFVAWVASGCATPGPVASPPSAPMISNAPAPAPVTASATRCAGGLGWLGRTYQLRYTEIADGHFGFSELHADFQRRRGSGQFTGVVTMTYRDRPDAVPRATTHVRTLEHSEVTQLLTALRDGIRTPPRPSEPRTLVSNSSESRSIVIDAIAVDGNGPDLHVQFYVESAQTEPHAWEIRGCASDPPLEARRALQATVDAFAAKLDRDASVQRLMKP